jgi:bacillopeptidase F (M6 metalloprotease family)
MTDFITISGNIDSSDTKIPLGVEVWIDNTCIINTDHVDSNIQFTQEIPDDESEHELRIVLKNKVAAHTKIDDQNQRIEDVVLLISD